MSSRDCRCAGFGSGNSGIARTVLELCHFDGLATPADYAAAAAAAAAQHGKLMFLPDGDGGGLHRTENDWPGIRSGGRRPACRFRKNCHQRTSREEFGLLGR